MPSLPVQDLFNFQTSSPNRQRLIVGVMDVAAVALGLGARWFSTLMLRYFPACIFGEKITCPACGGTHCVRYFFTGQFPRAFSAHPYLFCLIWYLAAVGLVLNIGYLVGLKGFQTLGRSMVSKQAVILLTIGFAVFGIIRLFVTL